MSIARVRLAFVGKVVSLRHLGDASLQRAFDAITGEIVRSVTHAQSGERSRLAPRAAGFWTGSVTPYGSNEHSTDEEFFFSLTGGPC
jgi:hypothetical protein